MSHLQRSYFLLRRYLPHHHYYHYHHHHHRCYSSSSSSSLLFSSSSFSPLSPSEPSVSPDNGKGNGTEGAPATPVTFTVCYSDKGELEEVA